MRKALVVVIFVATVVLVAFLLSLDLAKASESATGFFPVLPEVYAVGSRLYVTSTTAVEVWISPPPVVLTKTALIEGRSFYVGPDFEEEGLFYVKAGWDVVFVRATSVAPGGSYVSGGLSLVASDEVWGEVGIVSYTPGGYKQIFTLSGWGYALEVPVGLEFWNPEVGRWQEEPLYGFFTVVRVSLPEPYMAVEGASQIAVGQSAVFTATIYDAGPGVPFSLDFTWSVSDHEIVTETVTGSWSSLQYFSWETPGVKGITVSAMGVTSTHWVTVTVMEEPHRVFLPLVISDRPPECLQASPFEKLGWQTPEGYGVCSWQNPGPLGGVEPVRVQHERYNWLYPVLVGPDSTWLSPGDFSDGQITLSTLTHAGVSVVCANENCPEGFRRVYALWGFSYELSWWPLQGFWFDGANWVETPIWGEFTLFAVR